MCVLVWGVFWVFSPWGKLQGPGVWLWLLLAIWLGHRFGDAGRRVAVGWFAWRAAHNGRVFFFYPADVMVAPKFGLSLILFLFLMRFFFFLVVRKLQSSGPAIGHVKGSHVFIAKLLIEKRIGPFLCCVVKCLLNNYWKNWSFGQLIIINYWPW